MTTLRPFGLVGRIVAILLLTVAVEFGASTLLYERASVFSVRADEAHRIAEHLVIARHLIGERPRERRAAMAADLTTGRYGLDWSPARPPVPRIAPPLDGMREQIEAWEPSLARQGLALRLTAVGARSMITGELRLDDGSWLRFRAHEPVRTLALAVGRVLLALIPALALLVISGLLVRRTLQPMRQLALAADRIGRGSPAEVVEAGPGEVRRVTRAFNRMQDRIARLIDDRTRALAAVGHDLRTPLARLRLRVDSIPDAALRHAVRDDVREMEAMVASLLAYLGGDEDSETPVLADLAILCATLVDEAQDRGRDARYVGPDHHDHRLRPFGFKRALGNLVDNALHHGEAVTVRLEADAAAVTVHVEDDGPGIPEGQLGAVLQPFVRLDTARRRDTVGFGLGLSIVARAVAAEGATLTLANRVEGGLRATIVLPVNS